MAENHLNDRRLWAHHVEFMVSFEGIFSILVFISIVFIRPFEKRMYYAVAMSVRLSVPPSVRPSEFSGLFFNML